MAMSLSRAQLEKLVGPLLERTKDPCRNCLKDAGVTASEINEVLLVGGMSRMPKVTEIVKDLFQRSPNKGVNPDEVVALGAAVQAGVLGGEVSDIVRKADLSGRIMGLSGPAAGLRDIALNLGGPQLMKSWLAEVWAADPKLA